MTAMMWLPSAERDPRGRVLNWSERSDPKGCLHTTETVSWPSYAVWTVHPHVTVRPIKGRGVKIEQNVPFDRASFSLRNLPGGVQTNTDFVFQVELIGTCEKGAAYRYGAYYWPEADDTVLLALYREVIAPLSEAYDIPVRAPAFQAYPASYGPRSGTNNVRMSGPEFDVYTGWLGHQSVPENTHGDPGAFPWVRMIELGEDDMSAADVTAIKAAIPSLAQIVSALAPVVEAAAAKAAADAVKAWQDTPVNLGAFAGAALPGPDGLPATQHTAGNLLEWGAAHAAATHALVDEINDRIPPRGLIT